MGDCGGERGFSGCGEEGVDVAFGEGVGGFVELALDRGVVAGVAFAGDEVDTGVGLSPMTGPVDPPPHLLVLLRQHRVELEVPDHQLLELGSPFGIRGCFTERLDDLVN